MRSTIIQTATVSLFCTAPSAVLASGPASSEAAGGFTIMLGFVALMCVVVWLIRLATRSDTLAPDERNAEEFVRSTTPIDRPSIER
jgi:hypothetical protein